MAHELRLPAFETVITNYITENKVVIEEADADQYREDDRDRKNMDYRSKPRSRGSILNIDGNMNHLITQIARVKFNADAVEEFFNLDAVLEKNSNVGKEFKQETEQAPVVSKDQNGEIYLYKITSFQLMLYPIFNLSTFIYLYPKHLIRVIFFL